GGLLAERGPGPATDTQWPTARAQQLLARYGVVTREVAAAEGMTGGFGAVYDVLKALEDAGRVRRGTFVRVGALYDVLKARENAGRVRRGYFVGVGATQFALPPALELLRTLREPPEDPETVVLAATDPANPYGTTLKWPAFGKAGAAEGEGPSEEGGRAPTRTVAALFIMVSGARSAYIPRGGRQATVYLPDDDPARSTVGRA